MILVAIALADYKAYAQLDALEGVAALSGREHLLVHVTLQSQALERWLPLIRRAEYLGVHGLRVQIERWWDPAAFGGHTPRSVDDGTTRRDRVASIVQARNRSLAKARADRSCTHLLSLDADVVPPPDSLERLLALDAPLAAGVVKSHDPRCPGIPYVFHRERGGVAGNHYVRNLPMAGVYRDADFVTAGFLLARRDVLDAVPWRCDDAPIRAGSDEIWGEDPLFCFDARARGFGKPVVDCALVARHHAADGSWV